jgi:HK97 gp10 family phage protein
MSDIRIEGLEAILDRIDKVGDPAAMTAAMKKACLLVERSAKQKVPKGNGELGRSITSEVEVDAKEVRGIVYTPLEYAPYVEFGTGLFAEAGDGRKDVPWCYQDDEGEWHSTSGQHPRPFMRPALNENREQIKRLLEDAHND